MTPRTDQWRDLDERDPGRPCPCGVPSSRCFHFEACEWAAYEAEAGIIRDQQADRAPGAGVRDDAV